MWYILKGISYGIRIRNNTRHIPSKKSAISELFDAQLCVWFWYIIESKVSNNYDIQYFLRSDNTISKNIRPKKLKDDSQSIFTQIEYITYQLENLFEGMSIFSLFFHEIHVGLSFSKISQKF